MPYILKRYYPGRNIVFFLGEGLLIFLSVLILYNLLSYSEPHQSSILLYSIRSLVVTLIFQLSLYFFDLYDLNKGAQLTDTTAKVFQAFGTGCIILAGIYFIFPRIIIPSRIFFPGFLSVCLSIFFWRLLYDNILRKKMFAHNILLLGSGKLAEDIANYIFSTRDSGFNIVCLVSTHTPSFNFPPAIPWHKNMNNLLKVCHENDVDSVVVAFDDRRGTTPVDQLLYCKMNGLLIENGITFYEKLSGKILVEKVTPDWFIYTKGFNKGRILIHCKRLLDIFISCLGLLLTLPISLVSTLIILLESPGPAFYKQERVGEDGKTFTVLKFRSMRDDAEDKTAVWAQENDPRVTRYGKFIRKVRIDEIPQMWNVLKGNMSFVGPRPERPQFVVKLSQNIPYYTLRHSVKPGITGWAQICYPYGASEKDALHKLEYDLYYIKYLSLQMDCVVIFQTIKTILYQKGAR